MNVLVWTKLAHQVFISAKRCHGNLDFFNYFNNLLLLEFLIPKNKFMCCLRKQFVFFLNLLKNRFDFLTFQNIFWVVPTQSMKNTPHYFWIINIPFSISYVQAVNHFAYHLFLKIYPSKSERSRQVLQELWEPRSFHKFFSSGVELCPRVHKGFEIFLLYRKDIILISVFLILSEAFSNDGNKNIDEDEKAN